MDIRRLTENQKHKEFDLIIIGGGITGAAVAYAAAGRGLKIALFEKKDFGGATSAATSKLIHGGLRYLANMEFKLVRESLQERRILGNIAPNFVYPLPFIFPGYKSWKGNMWKMAAGMFLYDMLSFDKKNTWDPSKRLPNHKTLNYKQTIEKEPNLISEKLRNSVVFYDYQSIFPERLTLAFIRSAVDYGAEVSNYSEVIDFSYENNDTVNGVIVKDHISGQTAEYKAPLTVNCGGTWADKILEKAAKNKSISHEVKRSEGIHVITDKIAGDHVVSLQKKDGTHMMIMPWRNHSIIGTTDKEYHGSPDNYRVSKASIDEVINDVNSHYGKKISYKNIKHVYGGLRPLVDDQTEGSYSSSRKYEVYDNREDGLSGLITVEGGKYTTSRNLAKTVIDLVAEKLNRKIDSSVTHSLYLAGSEIRNMKEFMKKQQLHYTDFSKETVEYISRNYGTLSKDVFQLARDNKAYAKVVSHDGELLAEAVYAVQKESARSLKDILLRRTGIGTLGHPGKEILETTAQTAARLLGWSDEKTQDEINAAEAYFKLPE
jgi:glycerol-3-phosphate dehydrogenase